MRPLAEHSKHDRYNHSEKGRARWLRYYDKRWDDPDPLRRFFFRAKEKERKRVQKARVRRAKSKHMRGVPVRTGLLDAMKRSVA
jgi:hypothetical protein